MVDLGNESDKKAIKNQCEDFLSIENKNQQEKVKGFKFGPEVDFGQALRMIHAGVQIIGSPTHRSSQHLIDSTANFNEQQPQTKTVSSIGNFSSNEDNDEIESIQQSFYEAKKSLNQDFDLCSPDKVQEEPAPLVNTGYDLKVDMKLGWKPDKDRISGAPIPLHYEFCSQEHSYTDPLTGLLVPPLYLGPRIPNSLTMHKWYANKEFATSCEQIKSYKFDVPILTNIKLPKPDAPRKFIGMNPAIHNYDLRFDSNFESGNLDMVIQTQDNEYDLFMRVDTNTRGHHQWFYFNVQYKGSTMCDRKIKFNICNFTKPTSLYSAGMKICVARKSQDYQWHRAGEKISYGRSHHVRRSTLDPNYVRYYYKMSFTYNFGKQQGDQIYFAYCFPYTFSRQVHFLKELNESLKTLEPKQLSQTAQDTFADNKDLNEQQIIKKDCDFLLETNLCKTLSGVNVPLLTITSRVRSDPQYVKIKLDEFEDKESRISLPLYKKKKYIIISGRVHPGETPASFMMEGFLKYLCSDSYQAKQLRKRVIFKVVPMLNPDGVIVGNYRTSMAGCDLNRRYDQPDYRLHPTVWSIKQLTQHLLRGDPSKNIGPCISEDDLVAFIDLHGHSRKKNVFVFGPQVPLHNGKYLKMRVLPKLLSEETDMFRYHSCRFQNEKSKERAARIVLHKEFNICNCFTLEASFHGHFGKDNINHEFTPKKYEEMGAALVNSLYEYVMIVEEDERRKQFNKVERLKTKQKKEKEKSNNQSNQDNMDIANLDKSKKKLQKEKSKQSQGENRKKLQVLQTKKTSSQLVRIPDKTQVKKVQKVNIISQQISQNEVKEDIDPQSNNSNRVVEQENYDKDISSSEKQSVQSVNLDDGTASENSFSNPNEPEYEINQPTVNQTAKTFSAGARRDRAFRNLDEVLEEVQKIQEMIQDESSDDEEELEIEDQVEQLEQDKEEQDQDQDGSDDDLNADQVKHLNSQILQTIQQFRKALKITESEYFGIPIELPIKKLIDGNKKLLISQNSGVNYQSNTVSIAQKRRSYLEELKFQQKQDDILTGKSYDVRNQIRKKKSAIINSNFMQGQYQAVVTRNIKAQKQVVAHSEAKQNALNQSMPYVLDERVVNQQNTLCYGNDNNFRNPVNEGINQKKSDIVQREFFLNVQQQQAFAQSILNPEKIVIKGLAGMSSRPKINNDVNSFLIKGMTRLDQPQQIYQSPQSQTISNRQQQMIQNAQNYLTPMRKGDYHEISKQLKDVGYSILNQIEDTVISSPRSSGGPYRLEDQQQLQNSVLKQLQIENIIKEQKKRKPFVIKTSKKGGQVSAPPSQVMPQLPDSPIRQSTATSVAQKLSNNLNTQTPQLTKVTKKQVVSKQRTQQNLVSQTLGANYLDCLQIDQHPSQLDEQAQSEAKVTYNLRLDENATDQPKGQEKLFQVHVQPETNYIDSASVIPLEKPSFKQRMNNLYQKQQVQTHVQSALQQSKQKEKQPSRQIPVKVGQEILNHTQTSNQLSKQRIQSNGSEYNQNQIQDFNLQQVQRRSHVESNFSILAQEFSLPAQFVGNEIQQEKQNFFYDRKVNSNRKTNQLLMIKRCRVEK